MGASRTVRRRHAVVAAAGGGGVLEQPEPEHGGAQHPQVVGAFLRARRAPSDAGRLAVPPAPRPTVAGRRGSLAPGPSPARVDDAQWAKRRGKV